MNSVIGILILAAGGSARMHKPKQLLTYRGKSLLRHAAETALAVPGAEVVVVSGALHKELLHECNDLPVQVVYNADWQNGLSTSIHAGIARLEMARPDNMRGVLITLCDQPMVTAAHLNNLLSAFYGNNYQGIVATGYANSAGVPALFAREFFKELYRLKGDSGAKKLFSKHKHQLQLISFEAAAVDIDTSDDYRSLQAGDE